MLKMFGNNFFHCNCHRIFLAATNPYKSLWHIQLTGDVPDKTLVKTYFMGLAQGCGERIENGRSHQGPAAILSRCCLNKIDVGRFVALSHRLGLAWPGLVLAVPLLQTIPLANGQIMLLTHFYPSVRHIVPMVAFEASSLATQALDGLDVLVGISFCQHLDSTRPGSDGANVIKPNHACPPPGIML